MGTRRARPLARVPGAGQSQQRCCTIASLGRLRANAARCRAAVHWIPDGFQAAAGRTRELRRPGSAPTWGPRRRALRYGFGALHSLPFLITVLLVLQCLPWHDEATTPPTLQGEPRCGMALVLRLSVPLLALEVAETPSAGDPAPAHSLFRLSLFDVRACAALEGRETKVR